MTERKLTRPVFCGPFRTHNRGTARRRSEEVEASLKADGRRPIRREGMEDATWVLLDYGDVIVHVFDDATRRYYDLERLWGDAPRVDRPEAASRALEA